MRSAFAFTLLFLTIACAPAGHDMNEMHVQSEESFVIDMIPHHQEAVDTSRIVRESTENEELRDLADRIIAAQEQEIAMMQGWASEWYDGSYEAQYVPMMPDLAALEGKARDDAYLEGMIMHHAMAVRMAHDVLALDPRPEVAAFARNVIAAQEQEITQMRAMLSGHGMQHG